MNITLYGAASDSIDHVYIEGVEELGREMARRGHTMIFGAGATGLMGAAARGMHECGGHTVGVTPRFMNELEPVSPLCSELIGTETMAERKTVMEERADAFVIVPGGVGTWDEFFQILTLRVLGQHKKPIVLFNVGGFWNSMVAVIREGVEKHFVSCEVPKYFAVCDTANEVLDTLESK